MSGSMGGVNLEAPAVEPRETAARAAANAKLRILDKQPVMQKPDAVVRFKSSKARTALGRGEKR